MKKIKKTIAIFLVTAYFFASCAVNGEQKEQEVLTFDEFPEITNLSPYLEIKVHITVRGYITPFRL